MLDELLHAFIPCPCKRTSKLAPTFTIVASRLSLNRIIDFSFLLFALDLDIALGPIRRIAEMGSSQVIPWYYYYFFGGLEPVRRLPIPRLLAQTDEYRSWR